MEHQLDMFNPAMSVLARESRGLTQLELAKRLSMTQGAFSRVESGLRGVSGDLLQKLSGALDYPTSFFFRQDKIYGFGPSELYHRRRKNVATRTLNTIRAQINICRQNLERMLRGVEFPEIRLRSVELDDFNSKPEEVAHAARAWQRLPEHEPIHSLVKAVEDAGCIVVPFDFGTHQIDAISQWLPGMPPLLFVSTTAPCDRLRFNVANELGHLNMHQQDIGIYGERQADSFAAEFLMPAEFVRPYFSQLSLEKLVHLKRYWKVSMAALLKRASDLKMITAWQSRSLWMQMASAGYKTHEPVELDIRAEQPTMYQELIDTYRRTMGYTAAELGELMDLFEHEVRRSYFGISGHLKVVE